MPDNVRWEGTWAELRGEPCAGAEPHESGEYIKLVLGVNEARGARSVSTERLASNNQVFPRIASSPSATGILMSDPTGGGAGCSEGVGVATTRRLGAARIFVVR